MLPRAAPPSMALRVLQSRIMQIFPSLWLLIPFLLAGATIWTAIHICVPLPMPFTYVNPWVFLGEVLLAAQMRFFFVTLRLKLLPCANFSRNKKANLLYRSQIKSKRWIFNALCDGRCCIGIRPRIELNVWPRKAYAYEIHRARP